MLLHTLELEHVKCFARSPIDFTLGTGEPQRWVVVYGNNGMGKSTLLRAIGLALVGQPALNSLLPNAAGWTRVGKKHASVRVSISKGPTDTSVGYPRTRNIDLEWHLVGDRPTRINNQQHAAHTIFLSGGKKAHERADAKLFTEQISLDEAQRGWLLAGYGPLRRLSGASSDLQATMAPDGRAARLATLFHEKAALSTAESWLRALHHSKAAGNAAGKRNYDAVTKILGSGLLPEGVELAEVTPTEVLFRTPFAPKIPMPELSDGLRTVLAITLDLLRHVASCFDLASVVEHDAGETPRITAQGIVLIDELDSHLHPSWQRRIGGWLHERFPNLQFIVATHSPLIATRVSEAHGMVIRLVSKRIGKGHFVVPEVEAGLLGLTADQMLTSPNFGLASTRDTLTEQLLVELHELRLRKGKGKLDKVERARLDQLSFQFDHIAAPADTFDERKAMQAKTERIHAYARKLAKSRS